MAAAHSTGTSWGFPDDIPGAWSQDDVDAQIHPEDEHDHGQSQPDPQTTPPKRERTHWPQRTCRICLDVVNPTFHPFDENTSALPASFQPKPRVTYESPPGHGGRMIRPCQCKGSAKYVHEECLSAWRRQDPLQKRNYWECPTCRYRYRLQRLTWGGWISSIPAQLGLTAAIFVLAMFVLGFVADPIINLYIDPYNTIATAGGPTGSLLFEDEAPSWTEHFIKGLASLGLLGFAKFLLTLNPFSWWNLRHSGLMGSSRAGLGGTGRERLNQISWAAVVVGILMFLWAVWKGVRAWSRRTLEQAGERVMDVPGTSEDDAEDD